MEINEKAKQGIGIGVGIVGISVASVLGYWYYTKLKKQAKIDELLAEGEADMTENYNQDDRPRLSRIGNAEVNKIYPRDRFTVYDSNFNKVDDRFKIMETHSQAQRQKGRLRASGDAGGYYSKSYRSNTRLQQEQNPSLKDLGVW